MDKEFAWIKKIIDSVNNQSQIITCENLIELFKTKHWSDDFTNDEENEFKGIIDVLNQHLDIKKNRYDYLP
jgi:hypothetical protein